MRKTLLGASRIFDPKVMIVPLMSKLPTSLMVRSISARVGPVFSSAAATRRHDHRFRFRALDRAQCRANRSGITLECTFGRQLHAAFFERKLDAGQTVAGAETHEQLERLRTRERDEIRLGP